MELVPRIEFPELRKPKARTQNRGPSTLKPLMMSPQPEPLQVFTINPTAAEKPDLPTLQT
eukprot:3605629-Rhodomonas_salina.1